MMSTMRKLILSLWLVLPATALAQPGPPQRTPAELRQICADAMNADPSFAQSIIETANADTAKQHLEAADRVAKNERHVIIAYGAIWVVTALFVTFMWLRQLALKKEIAQLHTELAHATKDDKK
jgi:CcmD family protein